MHESARTLLGALGLPSLPRAASAPSAVRSYNPATGELLAELPGASAEEVETALARATSAFASWRARPAPKRGEVIRALGDALRSRKAALGELVSLEVGKIRSEGLGEVQEMIDVCEFAVGLSRQLHGLTIASERPLHRMMEQWHPLGPVAVVTAFNFPVAVWAWNAALAAVCGDTVLWKPSPRTPLTSLAVQHLAEEAAREHGADGLFGLLLGERDVGARLASDPRVALVSFTGSVAAGREVAARVAGRLGRSLLELGGNNAVIVLADADLDLATRAITFGAVGTAGQRCTSTRRLFVQRAVADSLLERLARAYGSVRLGDPLAEGTLLGPLVSDAAVCAFEAAVARAQAEGGEVVYGGRRVDGPGWFVEPTIVKVPPGAELPIAREETFAPILYVFEVEDADEATRRNNEVTQGLSSAIFTDSVRAAERFVSAEGSDCGIANVNLGTSGAEIGGAFGGEKDTGGGRESGSDAWKSYMRRQTNTVNYGSALPLAQGVAFV